jgi:hypothetical protein
MRGSGEGVWGTKSSGRDCRNATTLLGEGPCAVVRECWLRHVKRPLSCTHTWHVHRLEPLVCSMLTCVQAGVLYVLCSVPCGAVIHVLM